MPLVVQTDTPKVLVPQETNRRSCCLQEKLATRGYVVSISFQSLLELENYGNGSLLDQVNLVALN